MNPIWSFDSASDYCCHKGLCFFPKLARIKKIICEVSWFLSIATNLYFTIWIKQICAPYLFCSRATSLKPLCFSRMFFSHFWFCGLSQIHRWVETSSFFLSPTKPFLTTCLSPAPSFKTRKQIFTEHLLVPGAMVDTFMWLLDGTLFEIFIQSPICNLSSPLLTTNTWFVYF